MSDWMKTTTVLGCVLMASTSALAADNLAQPHYKAAAVMAAPWSWTGAYVGATAGYGWASTTSSINAIDQQFVPFFQAQGSIPRSLDARSGGFVGGGQIGYRWQVDRWVAGLETDLSYTKMRAVVDSYAPQIGAVPETLTGHTAELTWLGTARASMGYLATPDTLLYATGGLAYGRVNVATTLVPEPTLPCPSIAICSVGSAARNKLGWTIGGGAETKISANWTAKIEYLHYDLGTIGDTAYSLATNPFFRGVPVIGVDTHITGNIVRIGVNYQL